MNNTRPSIIVKQNNIRTLLTQGETCRHLLLGSLYVLTMILISSLWSSSSALDHESSHKEDFNQRGGMNPIEAATRRLRRAPLKRVRRVSTYAVTDRPSGIISLTSKREVCTAVLIHERVILTEGVCAQSLDQSLHHHKRWTATAKYVGSRYPLKSISAKVVKSKVNPHSQLAIHLLDRPLPYAPLKVQDTDERSMIARVFSDQKISDGLTQSAVHGAFVLSQSSVGLMNLVRGRHVNGQLKAISPLERAWIVNAQQGLRQVERDDLESSRSQADSLFVKGESKRLILSSND